jgi:hypothetical protein
LRLVGGTLVAASQQGHGKGRAQEYFRCRMQGSHNISFQENV